MFFIGLADAPVSVLFFFFFYVRKRSGVGIVHPCFRALTSGYIDSPCVPKQRFVYGARALSRVFTLTSPTDIIVISVQSIVGVYHLPVRYTPGIDLFHNFKLLVPFGVSANPSIGAAKGKSPSSVIYLPKSKTGQIFEFAAMSRELNDKVLFYSFGLIRIPTMFSLSKSSNAKRTSTFAPIPNWS